MNSVAALCAIAVLASASPARSDAPPTAQELGYPAECKALYGDTGGLHLIKITCPGPLIAPPPTADPIIASCREPSEDDLRPFALCVAETRFERADLELNRQWAVTLAHVRANRGESSARRVRNEQREWMSNRDRECGALAAPSPVTQAGRNEMGCMAQLTEKRTAQLKAMVESE